jgi:predicted N-acetyltransferase YhbS
MAAVHAEHDADAISRIIRSAVDERQRLRRSGADTAALEANRRAIAYWQGRLSKALIDGRRPG